MKGNRRRYWAICMPTNAALMGDIARGFEAAGLEGMWGIQLYGPPFITLAAAAMVTKRLKLGTGVALAFTRSPLETALSAIDVDTISGGRMVLGLGTSLRSWNENWHGVSYGKPIAHLREVVRIVRAIIAGARSGTLGRIEGQYHKLDLTGFKTPMPPVRDRIPIYIPAVFESGVRLAGEIAYGLAGHPIWSARWLENEVKDNLEASLDKAGRKRSEFDLNVWAWVAIDKNRKQALADARPTVAFYAAMKQYRKYFAAHGFEAQAHAACEAAQRNDIAGMVSARYLTKWWPLSPSLGLPKRSASGSKESGVSPIR
jgi:alkanesulfonate monooxygenase SsuD/methylene tetrahydromethanopterin reductase-like flavin-dependent oxidoreductase (luciferase family)